MAVTIKIKQKADAQVLEDIGLFAPTEPTRAKKKGAKVSAPRQPFPEPIQSVIDPLHIGTKVTYTNDVYFWIKDIQVGDMGVIEKYIPHNLPAFGARMDLFEIKLDNPRVTGKTHRYCRRWELTVVGE
jgi:hypothetical protein